MASPPSIPTQSTDAFITAALWNDLVNALNSAFPLGLGAWTNYAASVTWTNLTVGNGTVLADYYRIGRTIFVRGSLQFGSTTSIAGTFRMALPVAPAAGSWHMIQVSGEDASAANVRTVGAGQINTAIWGNDLQPVSSGNAGWSATVPFTWATSDMFVFSGFYQAAS